jgi:phosphopantothenoylcysteine decarboxylase/phosphopantothenate--cysteine ligase
MNNRMYLNPATQANVAKLRARGVTVLEPGTGALASRGESGVGRLPEPAELLAAAEAAMLSAEAAALTAEAAALGAPGAWDGLRVLVSAGGTQEPIDAVRFIGNHSSGRMGYALAQQARARGATVTLLSANVRLPVPDGVELVPVHSAAELETAARAHFPASDVLIMAAAVADFRPAHPAGHKLKKTGAETPLELVLEPTSDIISGLAAGKRPGQILVGFAAEHGDGAIAYGRDKLARKGLDAVVVNDISRPDIGFDATENEVTIITAEGEWTVAKSAKATVADRILDTVAELRERTGARPAGTARDGARH